MNQPKIQLKGYRVLVELDRITNSNIALPEAVKKVKNRGTVVAVGDGRFNHAGDRARFDVEVGDRVLLSEFAVTPYLEDGREFRICAGEDILGVLL